MSSLQDKVVFITGASRGIGRAIALRCAAEGARVAIAAKTSEPHPKLEGTIHTVASEVEAAGGEALPLVVDVRNDEMIADAIANTFDTWGGIDILVNNASALFPAGTLDTPMKRFDLMFDVNVRATFACSQAAIPHLERAANPHILNIAPPLDLDPKWFAPHVAYTMSKFGMSMCTLGMAEELKSKRIAVNSLWPKTAIATAAILYTAGEEFYHQCRKPEIMADAAYTVLTRPSDRVSGNFFIDEQVLVEAGVTDFSTYAMDPTHEPPIDIFVKVEQ